MTERNGTNIYGNNTIPISSLLSRGSKHPHNRRINSFSNADSSFIEDRNSIIEDRISVSEDRNSIVEDRISVSEDRNSIVEDNNSLAEKHNSSIADAFCIY
jgi:hypothetical protein